MSGSDKKPHAQMYAPLFILDKVQKSRINTGVKPNEYFRDVATSSHILCDVNLMFYLETEAETDWQTVQTDK